MIIEARKNRITLCGAIERNHWKTIRAAAQLLLEHSPSGIVVDCRQINKTTPAGISTFEQAIDEISAQGSKMIFAGLPPALRQIVSKIRGLRSEMVVMDTVEEAERMLGIETRYNERPVGIGELNVVVMGGTMRVDPSIVLASLLGTRRLTRLHITHMVDVPQDLPLSAMTSEIEEAGRALDLARSFAERRGFPPTVEIAHIRTLEAGLNGVISDLNPNAVFLSVPHSERQILSRLIYAGMDLHVLLGGESFHRPPEKTRKLSILLPIHEKLAAARVLKLVSRFSNLPNKEVILCVVVEVPRSLPLVVPTDKAAIMNEALERFLMRFRSDRIKHRVVVLPVRDFTLGLKNVVKSLSPDCVILDPLIPEEAEKLAAAALPNMGCDVLWLTRSRRPGDAI
ncbi:MAG: STAS domain-containing protein [Nitrospirota bacterium]